MLFAHFIFNAAKDMAGSYFLLDTLLKVNLRQLHLYLIKVNLNVFDWFKIGFTENRIINWKLKHLTCTFLAK